MPLFGHRHAHAAPRAHLLSALGVALAAVGCAPPGPQSPASAADALRSALPVAGEPALELSVLRSSQPDPSAGSSARLILVHGTPGTAAGWIDYLMDPPPGVEVLALDRPGFGQSGPGHAMPGLADQARAVAALLPDDGRPTVLLGHSLGGAVVAKLAARLGEAQPDRVLAVVLVAASLDPALEVIHPLQQLGAWGPVRALVPRTLRHANEELMALKVELDALALELPRVRAPVVIVHGTRDELVPVANVAYLQSRLSAARCVTTRLLDGRNHFLPWNSAPEVREAIRLALEPAC